MKERETHSDTRAIAGYYVTERIYIEAEENVRAASNHWKLWATGKCIYEPWGGYAGI